METPLASLPSVNLAPIDTPPSPDLDLSANRGPRVVGVAAFLFVISFIIVSLRFVGRYLSKAGIWWDDWLCLGAMVVAWGTCILCFLSPENNFGKHEAALDPADAIYDTEAFLKMLFAYENLYTVAITLAKYSIILFYARIFTERSFRIALWVVGAMVTIFFIVCQIVQLIQCRPISALWDGTFAENCIDIVRFFAIAGGINCVINFILLVMPLPMVWGLEIDKKAKVGLSITFLMGVFVFAVSAARIYFVRAAVTVDVTWSFVDSAIWTTVEPNIAVVSASLPILRSLWILLNPHRSIQTRSTQNRGLSKRNNRQDPGHTEKTVAFADSLISSPVGRSPAPSIFRGLSTRTKPSVHHNTPNSSAFGVPYGGPPPVSPVYDGGYMSPGGVSDITSLPTGGLSRKTTVGGRSEDSTAPLNAASELPAHRSIPYGGGDYARYTVNISSDAANQRQPSKPSSIASRMGVRSPKIGGTSPRVGQTSRKSSFDEPRSIEMSKLPTRGGRGTPSPGPFGPRQIERSQSGGLHSGGRRHMRDSESLSGRFFLIRIDRHNLIPLERYLCI